MKIFIVDDEKPVIEGLSVVIRKRLPELTIAGTASAGREAIERVATAKPDILLLDVKMPGLTGLDALREIRKADTDVATIMLTAYERFDIAREAFELGVFDYLVKPASQDLLVSTIRAAMENLRVKRERRDEAMAFREKFELAKPFLRSSFVALAIADEADPASLDELAGILGLANRQFVVVAYEERIPDTRQPPGTVRRHWGARMERLKSGLSFRSECLFGLPVGAPFGAVYPVFFVVSGSEGAAAALSAARAILSEPEGEGLAAGACIVPSAIEARRAWSGAREAAETAAPGTLAERGSGSGPERESPEAQSAFFSFADRPSLRPRPLRPRVVESALRFVGENFARGISLEETAEAVGANPAYLSRAFSEEMGTTFIDYLTGIRMDCARRKLGEGVLSIKEIAAGSGYSDPNYFSRLFKKVCGLTPSEYSAGQGSRAK